MFNTNNLQKDQPKKTTINKNSSSSHLFVVPISILWVELQINK
jgi:hypothetical protein